MRTHKSWYGVTMDNTAAWAGLLRVHAALVPVLDQELQAAHGLPLTWYDVLLELNSAPERRLTMGELGAKAVVSRSLAGIEAHFTSRMTPAEARTVATALEKVLKG